MALPAASDEPARPRRASPQGPDLSWQARHRSAEDRSGPARDDPGAGSPGGPDASGPYDRGGR